MKNKPCCRACEFRRSYRVKRAMRYQCYCEHPRALEAFKKYGGTSSAGFIGFSLRYDPIPLIKTSPKWCPLEMIEGGDPHA